MDGLIAKMAGLAIAIAVVVGLVAKVLPSAGPLPTQRERLVEAAKVDGASNVRIRAAAREAQREPIASAVPPAPVILPLDGSPPSSAAVAEVEAISGYGGTAPVPQTTFADSNPAGGEVAQPPPDAGNE